MYKHLFFLALSLLLSSKTVQAQFPDHKKGYNRGDTLRGSLRPARSNYDVLKYDLSVEVDIEKKFINGVNKITFKVLGDLPKMQVDLYKNMKVDSIKRKGKSLQFDRNYNAVFIDLPQNIEQGSQQKIEFFYSGNPIVAKNPPWDGGFVFTKDKLGNPWVSVAVQGAGASLWYPNKDHLSDEPESAEIHVTTPDSLMNVSNGRLLSSEKLPNGKKRWNWKVENPINNYNIILNIGNYVNFSSEFQNLKLDYYVLSQDLEKAKKQFQQVKPMMKCFTEKLGPYPFPEDSYKLVQTPFLGMEHQSAVAYGNKFKNGYMGSDLSRTGIGMKFDFIIIHESGHEWFGNSITAADIADLWIHEAFTTYSEVVYVECQYGKEEALQYLKGLRGMVKNDKPIIGDYGVNNEGSGDMYFKGANMLGTLRSIIGNDKKWWKLLQGFTDNFKHRITNTEEVVQYFNERTEIDVRPFFKQYLNYTKLPILHLKKDDNSIFARWETDVENFPIPVDILFTEGQKKRIRPSTKWGEVLSKTFKNNTGLKNIEIDDLHYYIKVKKHY